MSSIMQTAHFRPTKLICHPQFFCSIIQKAIRSINNTILVYLDEGTKDSARKPQDVIVELAQVFI